ncbi:MAG: sialidase family protein [Planctomycetia bacterium]|nr:sialidase family protein [Planctomycetia bacterium]
MRILSLYFIVFLACSFTFAAEPSKEFSKEEKIAGKMEIGWKTAWTKFYSPKTHLFYDFIEDYRPGHELDHLPTKEELNRQYPNECGYGTAMEDCMISAGVLLPMVIDRYIVSADESMKKYAYEIFKGIESCATVHGSPGFIARGISPFAPNQVYVNTSRDQTTHVVYGLWEYYFSPLSNEAVKKRIEKILSDIADRMEKNVVPENDYDFLCADGSRCRRGICKMYKVKGHEAARLPMFYAAAWNTTGKQKYYDLWRKYIEEAADLSVNLEKNTDVNRWVPSYALLQMQTSLVLLHRLERDPALKDKLKKSMIMVNRLAAARMKGTVHRMKNRDLTEIAPDWRKAGGLNGEYRKTWYAIREAGELALTQLMYNPAQFPKDQIDLLSEALLLPDYEKISTCGLYDLLGAWWKARRYLIYNLPGDRRGFSIPTVDISGEKNRQTIIAEGTDQIYQGHPTTVLLPNGKTIFVVWSINHAGYCGSLKRSDDGGLTWSGLLKTPESWKNVKNCPAIYRLPDPNGKYRLVIYATDKSGKIFCMYSNDEGKSWSDPVLSFAHPRWVHMPWCSVIPIDQGKRLLAGTVAPRPRDPDRISDQIIACTSTDGGLTWNDMKVICDVPGFYASEPCFIRSPNGKEIACLTRESSRRGNSWITFSRDEGKSWSDPRQVRGSLTGDRHVARYLPDGRLIIVFRDMAHITPTKTHFIAWIGKYDDLVQDREGEYRIKLLHSYAGWDCGYPGLEILPDGTVVATTYIKYWDDSRKQSVVCTRFKMDEMDKKLQAKKN